MFSFALFFLAVVLIAGFLGSEFSNEQDVDSESAENSPEEQDDEILEEIGSNDDD
jgi:hypothetical protein